MANLPNFFTMQVPAAQIVLQGTKRKRVKDISPSRSKHGLSLARVVSVDEVTHEITLRIFTGQDDEFQRTAVVNSYPAAGGRHFMGALPEKDDVCVVGYFSTEPEIPVILAWFPISVSAGIEWLIAQDFLPTEVDFSPKVQSQFEGIYSRRRYKMRAMSSGDILLSSSRGSDILLDEGVLITNRRANEIRLRDQDQALVVRSLQQFHAMAGVRTYSGMVQRDAKSLPARMFSDGIDWAAAKQRENGSPLPSSLLGESPIAQGGLNPHAVFLRSDPSFPFPDSGQYFSENLDPYNFLHRGLFIGSDGFATSPEVISDTEYGGKPIFRVSLDLQGSSKPSNSIADQSANTLTEYRIEIDHTSDGRLPVTEQTDGIDIDRLPASSDQQTLLDTNLPFIELVYGSVVGNDAFSPQGRLLYRLPLVPRIFDQESVDPRMESGVGVDIGEHAASLLRIRHPLAANSNDPAFVSFTKDGRLKAFLSGPQDQNSLEVALSGGMRLDAKGEISLKGSALNLNFDQGDSTNNYGFSVRTQTGAIRLSAGGPSTKGSAVARTNPEALSENSLPHLDLAAPNGNAQITSGGKTKISGAAAIQLTDTNEVSVVAKNTFRLYSDKILSSCNVLDRTVQGKETTLYSGPKNMIPSNGPLREVKFTATPLTGHVGGVTDEYLLYFGDRKETIQIGDHSTEIQVGNLTYRTLQGNFNAQAGVNQMRLDSTQGMTVTVTAGSVNVTSTTTASLSGTSGVTVKSSGLARVSGSTTILGGNGSVGQIISSSDNDPLTNLPFSFFGMGSVGHLLGPSI